MLLRAYQQLKNEYHFLQAHFWRLRYGRPDRGLKIFGVTGTNGKTTTCHLMASILQQEYGQAQVGMLTTIAFWIGDTKITNATKMTTLPSRKVFAYLRDMRQRGVTHVVLELTSHALDQRRLAGIKLQGAIILNIAREHLDYHGTMPAYADAKAKIVELLVVGAPLVGKADDVLVAPIIQQAQDRGVPVHTFTSASAASFKSALPGTVNQENAAAATLLMQAMGVDVAVIAQGIAAVTSVPGRMQWLELPTGAKALIDYAVTPDALEHLYRDVRQHTPGKIFAILGAAGRRDRGKRAAMAKVVAQYADELILTREDPWTEPEEQIFKDLEEGLVAATAPHRTIIDRREALRYCIKQAGVKDVVVATGKGAETGMGIGKHVVPWNEAEIILEIARAVSAERK